jgi:hypothetical protein
MFNDDVTEAQMQQLATLYPEIAEAVKRGMSRQQIIDDLKTRGLSEALAIRVTDGTIQKVRKAQRQDRISRAMAEIVVGGVVFIVALVISASALVIGGVFLTGALIFGFGAFVRGIVRLVRG